MAYAKNTSSVSVIAASGAASITSKLGAHASGDLLLVAFITHKNGSGDADRTWTATAGWTSLTTANHVYGNMNIFWKIAASSSETAPTGTPNTTTTMQISALSFVVKDVPSGTVIGDFVETGAMSSASSVTVTAQRKCPFATVTTGQANTMLLCIGNVGSTGSAAASIGPTMTYLHESQSDPGRGAWVAGWFFKETAGATGAVSIAADGNYANGAMVVIPIKPGTTNKPGRLDHTAPHYTLLETGARPGNGYDPIATVTEINGKTTNYLGVGGSSTGFHPQRMTYPYYADISTTPGQYAVRGYTFALSPASLNLTGKKIICHTRCSDEDLATMVADGQALVFGIGSGTGDWRFYHCGARDTRPGAIGYLATVIDPSSTTLAIDTQGTFDITAAARALIGCYDVSASAGDTRWLHGEFQALNTMIIVGGSASLPATLAVADTAAETSLCQTVTTQNYSSATQFFAMQDIQVGNGTDDLYFQMLNTSLEFPTAASAADNKYQYQVFDESIEFTLYGITGDTIDIRNTTISGGSKWNFTIHASATSAATWTISSLVIINAYVSLRPIMTFGNVSFIGCDTLNAAALNSSTLSGGCAINETTGTAGVTIVGVSAAALQTELDKFANCSFGSNSAALRVEYTGAAADISLDFTNITWTGNTTDIHYQSTNASTLTAVMVDGSNATTTAISGAAVAAVISNDAVLTITISPTGTELTILQTGTTTEDHHVETAGTSEAFTFIPPLGHNVDIQINKAGYKPYWQGNLDLGSASSSLSVTLEDEPASQL